MAIKKRTGTITVSGTTGHVDLNLGAAYASLLGFSCVSVGTSTTQKLTITDADSLIAYTDAAARDYDTAQVNTLVAVDNTVTGAATTWVGSDNTGAAAATGEPFPSIPMRSPVIVSVAESVGGNEVLTVSVYVEV